MAPFSLSGIILFGVGARALVYPWPRETKTAAIPLDAQTPKPTAPAALHQFLRRQNNDQTVLVAPDNTCGYVSGQSAAAYTCVGTTNRCVFVTALDGGYGAAGCCNNFECGFRVTCVDFDQLASSSCDAACQSDSLTEKCTLSGAPFCNTIQFPGGITDYFCNSVRVSTAQLASTTYAGQVGRSFEQTVLVDTATSTRSPRSSTATPSQTNGPASSTPAAPSSGSSTPVGAIVGGVVGGVAVLALIIFGIFFMLRRSKKTDPSTPPSASETAQYPPLSPFPNPSPGINNTSPSPASAAAAGAAVAGSKPGHQSVASSYNPPYSPSGFGHVTTPTPPTDYTSPQFQQQGLQPGPDYTQRFSDQSQQQPQQGYDQQGGYNPHWSGQSYNAPSGASTSWPPPPHPSPYGPGGAPTGQPAEMDGQGRGRAYELG